MNSCKPTNTTGEIVYGRCSQSLHVMIGFLDQQYLKRCNLIRELYDESYYAAQHLFYKGYRDYYMQAAGSTQLLANLGLIVDSAYQTFKADDEEAYKAEQSRFGGVFGTAIAAVNFYNFQGID